MSLSSYCRNCGQSKSIANYADDRCPACETLKTEAEQGFAAENADKLKSGELTTSDVLYAGRMALTQRAIHANRNYTDPRGFSATRGQIPKP
jgi:hypothetical protein